MRAPRFPLHLKVRYRRTGDAEWRLGRSENISRSGILCRAPTFVEIDAPVELRIALPAGASESEAAEILCRGRVVRALGQTNGYSAPGFAVAIEHYDFLPSSAPFLPDQ